MLNNLLYFNLKSKYEINYTTIKNQISKHKTFLVLEPISASENPPEFFGRLKRRRSDLKIHDGIFNMISSNIIRE